MSRKKTKKVVNVEEMAPLSHNPFAALGKQFGVSASPDAPEPTPEPAAAKAQPMLMVRAEKRKKGHLVTAVHHLLEDHKGILKQLKQQLSTGGTVQDGIIELQGSHVERVATWLEGRGFKVRRVT